MRERPGGWKVAQLRQVEGSPQMFSFLIINQAPAGLIMMVTITIVMMKVIVPGPRNQFWSSTGWQKLHGDKGGPPPKSLDQDENFKPEHTLFCCKLRFVAIYTRFGDLWAKKVPFWFKNSVSWARSACTFTWYILHISLS